MTTDLGNVALATGDHVVQFYGHESDLYARVGRYLAAAVGAGETGIVIATPEHREAFGITLTELGIDVVAAATSGRLVMLDALTTMSKFIIDGEIDPARFRAVIGAVVRAGIAAGGAVRAYGEMVALLWDEGNVLTAIELEALWNELGEELPFSLFCAYPADLVSGPAHPDALHQVCQLHSSVLGSPGDIAAAFPADLAAPRAARHFVVTALRRSACDEVLVDDAALICTELATNAVLHARSPFSVALRVDESSVRIAVRDDAAMGRESLSVDRRHGLGLVTSLTHSWGVDTLADGKIIWAELAHPERTAQ